MLYIYFEQYNGNRKAYVRGMLNIINYFELIHMYQNNLNMYYRQNMWHNFR